MDFYSNGTIIKKSHIHQALKSFPTRF